MVEDLIKELVKSYTESVAHLNELKGAINIIIQNPELLKDKEVVKELSEIANQ